MTKDLAVTGLMSLYAQAQILIETQSETNKENEYISILLKTPYFQEILKDKQILNRIANNSKIGSTTSKKDPIFFHEAFDIWVNRLCQEKII